MSTTKKVLALLLALALMLSLAACGGSAGSSAPAASASEATAAESEAAPEAEAVPAEDAEEAQSAEDAESAAPAEIAEPEAAAPNTMELPLTDEVVTFSILGLSNPNMTSYGDPSEYNIFKRLKERTNIDFEWTMDTMFTITETHSLLVAANDLPEIVGGNFYVGGVASAIDEEVYWDLAPYLEEFAPDYYNLIQTDGIRQQVYSDDGYVMFFNEIAEKEFAPNNGILVRQDMLDQVGLDVPVTYDDYTEVLGAFKNELGMEAPFFVTDMDYDVFSAGFGISSSGFSLDDDGNMIYGPTTDEFKEYLKQFNEWYEAGYIYKDFYCIPFGEANNFRAEYMGADKSAVTFCYCEFAGQFVFENEDADLVPGYIPRQTEDQQIHLTGGIDAQVKDGWCVSTNCDEEKLELFCQFMNYLYTQEGAELCNWGIEGETFEYREDGSKWYTDEIMNNPDGMTQTQAIIFNFMYQAPCYADYTKYNISTLTTWKDFADVWAAADNKNKMPTMSLTADEESAYAAASTDVSTYMDEIVIKFMIGDADIDAQWDTYLDTMDSLGANEMIDIYAAAYERYQNK